jgi:anionic cell wall polymer biosynthesis LytR-Cps2A-Psr (LCP) family protein
LIATGVGIIMYGISWAAPRIESFTQAAETSFSEAAVTGAVGWWKTKPRQTNGQTRLLVLGLDSLVTRGSAPALTDTMMLINIDHQSGRIKTLSIPRDTWNDTYQARLNTMYFYGLEKNPNHPEAFAAQAISDQIEVPIDYTLVITLDQLAHLIDLVGGVNVTVEAGFTDPLFPRTDVDVTVESDPSKLYETVTFESGLQVMDGQRALKYIRSRKSEGPTGGDGARSQRQQQVIEALLATLSQDQTFRNPQLLGQLYRYYQQTFAEYLPMTDAIALGKILWPYKNNLKFEGETLSIYPEDPNGSLVHPNPNQYNGQWLYIVRDQEVFVNEIKAKLDVI